MCLLTATAFRELTHHARDVFLLLSEKKAAILQKLRDVPSLPEVELPLWCKETSTVSGSELVVRIEANRGANVYKETTAVS